MRVMTGVISAAALLAFAVPVDGADAGKDKAAASLKANQVLLKVPGMHWPVGWPAKVRSALKSLQFVEKDKPIEADIKTQQVIFTVTDRKKFDAAKVKEALKAKGYPKAEVLAGPK